MKAPLRNHPKLVFRGQPAWPPQPSGGAFDPHRPARLTPFHAGICRGATVFRTHGYGGLPDHLKLQIESEGRLQVADLWVDDTRLLEPLRAFLDQHKGLPLDELGGLEIKL